MITKSTITIFMILLGSTRGFIHKVEEGSVGITYRNGRLLNYTSPPNRYLYIPLISHMSNVNVRVQVDDISGIKCTPSEGSIMEFRLLVNNQLREEFVIDNVRRFGEIYDDFLLKQPITQKMTEWCTGKTFKQIYNTDWETLDTLIQEHLKEYQIQQQTNLDINSVTVFKPKIDPKIQENFDTATREKTKREAEVETRKRALEEAKTRREVEEAEAEKEKQLAIIQNQKLVNNKETEMKIKLIEEEGKKNMTLIRVLSEAETLIIRSESEKNATMIKAQAEANSTMIRAEAQAYMNKILAESETIRFSDAYLQKHWQEHVLANATLIYGEKIPTYMGANPTLK